MLPNLPTLSDLSLPSNSSLQPSATTGVASTLVGLKDDYGEEVSSIDITKLGEGSIEYCDNDGNGEADELCRWGDYSAAQVYEGNMWYAVPYAEWGEQYRSWIGVIKC